MRIRRPGSKRGAVLIAVLAMTALAAAIAMEIAYLVRVEGDRVSMERDRVQAELLARSATLLAFRHLDSLAVKENPSAALTREPLVLALAEGKAEASILDESARFPLHALFDEEGRLNLELKDGLERLAEYRGFRAEVVDCIIDYIDVDDVRFPEGAESEWYGTLSPPRRAANRPLLSPLELLRVKGLEGDRGKELAGDMTIFGNGLVNVNTAPAPVLMSLSPAMTRLKAERVEARARSFPLKSLSEFAGIAGIEPAALPTIERRATLEPSSWRIESRGTSGGVTVRETVVVKRGGEGLEVEFRGIS